MTETMRAKEVWEGCWDCKLITCQRNNLNERQTEQSYFTDMDLDLVVRNEKSKSHECHDWNDHIRAKIFRYLLSFKSFWGIDDLLSKVSWSSEI